MGLFAGRGEFHGAAESRGLVVHVGAQRIPSEGGAVPAGSGAAGRPDRRHAGVSAGAGGMDAGLSTAALDEHFLQPDCGNSVWIFDWGGAVVGNFADAARKDDVGLANKNWVGGGGFVRADADEPVGHVSRGIRYACVVRKFRNVDAGEDIVGCAGHGTDGDDRAAGRGAVVPGSAAGTAEAV